MGAGDGAKEAACLPCLAAEPVGEDDRLIAPRPAGTGCSCTQFPDAAGDPGRHVVERFRRFLCQKRFRLFRQVQPILFRNGKRLRAGGGVRHRRAAGDHVQRVAQNITEDDAEYVCRSAALCEPPSLDPGKPLADGVHLHDVGPAGKELMGDVLQFPAGEQRLFKQRAAAAREQKQYRVLCGQPLHQLQRLFGGRKAVFVRDGMACFITVHPGDLAFDVAILGHDHAAVHPAQCFHGGAGHLPSGLARRHQHHLAALGLKGFQCTADGLVRQDSAQAGPDDGVGIPSQRFVHPHVLHFCGAPLSAQALLL